MPANPTHRARQAGGLRDLETINLHKDLELKCLDERDKRVTRWKDEREGLRTPRDSRMQTLLQKIYAIFEPYITKPDLDGDTVHFLPASDFEFLSGDYSRPTVIKAKKLLGIRSIRYGNGWCWTLPRFSPEKRMQQLHTKQLSEIDKVAHKKFGYFKRPIARELSVIMIEGKFDCLSKEVIDRLAPYKRNTIIRAKVEMRIISLKKTDGWHWIWPAQEVQDWLLEQLQDGPVALEHLFKIAMWSEDVVRLSAQAAGGIVIQMIDGKVHWRLR